MARKKEAAPEPEVAVNEFRTDTHRRIAGMLMRPRSAAEIAAEFAKHDPWVEGDPPRTDPMTGEVSEATGAYTAAGVTEYLEDLEAEGLAVNMGNFEEASAALEAQNGNPELVDFAGDSGSFFALAEAERKYPYLSRADHWVRTNAAQARLVGPVPGAPGTEDLR